MMELSIVIVTHDSAAVLGTCLRGIGPTLLDSVLVVDNGSSDDTVPAARAAGVRVMEMGRNKGFAVAANAGAEAADARFLCFLNPDTVPWPGLFEAGVEAVRGRRLDCAVPWKVGMGGILVDGCQPGYTPGKLLAAVLRSNYGIGPPRADGRGSPVWHWPLGTCLFVSRERFGELGGFDRRYFLYMEDVDFGWRLHVTGGRVIPLDGTLQHSGARGADLSPHLRLLLLNWARIRFARIHYGRFIAAVAAIIAAPGAFIPRRRRS